MIPRVIKPISALEFASMMREITPPVGWSKTLAVANSGGPDSTCLLFLLNRYFNGQGKVNHTSTHRLPHRLVSLTIDHNLQESSAAMADRAATIAESMGIEHVTSKLPWGQENYPQKPEPKDKIEEKARDMRQMVLFERMKDLNANALALGHHIDDQIETMFMRLGRGSSELGLAGMRPCRRWGMGSRNDARQPYAIEGMRAWVVRPLLGVGKDRILATCEEQSLNYVTDITNFQPHLTIRNAIRHVIQHGGTTSNLLERESLTRLPPTTIQNLADIESAASRVTGHDLSLTSDLQRLRIVNQVMSTARSDTDKAVDEIIRKHRIPSPPGTFMISPLSIKAISSQVLREAFLFRITRYVSPEPWGHPQAELGRRKTSVNRLTTHLCDVDSFSTRNNNSLCVGSGVWWRLVSILPKKLSLDVAGVNLKDLAWIALRQPPERSNNKEVARNALADLTPEVTKEIMKCKEEEGWSSEKVSPIMEFLYDHRFLIRFSVDKIEPSILKTLLNANGKIFIKPTKPWAIPQVVLQTEDSSIFLQTAIIPEPFLRHRQLGGRRPHKDIHSEWITIQFFRPLSPI